MWEGRKKAFITPMKALSHVRREEKGLHEADEDPFACGKAGKRPS